MDALLKLSELNKCCFYLSLNPHKSYYEDAKEYYQKENDYPTIGAVDYSKDIWVLQIYVNTPIVFHVSISNNLEALLQWGIMASQEKQAL